MTRLGVDPKAVLTDRKAVISDLRRYFSDESPGTFTGRWFDRIGRLDGAVQDADRFTSDDIVAVSTLSVQIPPEAAVWLINDEGQKLSSLLSKVPVDPIWKVEANELDDSSAAAQLWSELDARPGIGWVTANKLIAHKRPETIPVYDRVIKRALQPPSGKWWLALQNAFDEDLVELLGALRADAGLPESISLLRILDVAIWMPNH